MSIIATRVFNFIRENENLTTTVGMEGVTTGFHKYYMIETAKAYGIDMSRYTQMISEYENEMLKKQHREYEARKR